MRRAPSRSIEYCRIRPYKHRRKLSETCPWDHIVVGIAVRAYDQRMQIRQVLGLVKRLVVPPVAVPTTSS